MNKKLETKKKILLLIKTSENLGGAERRLIRVFSRIIDYEVTIFIVGVEKKIHTREKILEFIPNVNNIKIFFNDNIIKYYSHIKKNKYEWVIFCNESLSFVMYSIISKIFSSKILWIVAYTKTAYMDFANLKHKILYKFYSRIANRIDCLYPNSMIIKDKKIQHKVTVTPLPYTDLNLFIPILKKKQIVYASRIEKGKGWELFLEAIYLLVKEKQICDYEVYICGSGSQDKFLKDKLFQYNLDKSIKLTGYIDMEDILPQSRIFLSLQENENYPSQVLLEAISSGCACIITNVGNSWMLAKKDFSQLVEPKAEDISKAIQNYIKLSDNDFSILSQNARKFANENFDINKSITYYSQLLKDNM